MKTWQKYVFIYIPIGMFCCIVNFCVKNDDKPPYAKYHLLHEFEKDEYSVNDLVTGDKLGELIIHKNDGMMSFDVFAGESGGTLMCGEYGDSYNYDEIRLQSIAIEKVKHKNLEFYFGKLGEWHSVVIMDLDNYDCYKYYKSNKQRYLFYLYKNTKYNFSVKDDSVYDLYVSFSGTDGYYTKYGAILE